MCSDPKAHAKHAEGAMSVLVRTDNDGSSLSAIVNGADNSAQAIIALPSSVQTYGNGEPGGVSVTFDGQKYDHLIQKLLEPGRHSDYHEQTRTAKELNEKVRGDSRQYSIVFEPQGDAARTGDTTNHHTYNGPSLVGAAYSGSNGNITSAPVPAGPARTYN